eukprot:gene543-438_t
MRVVVVTFGGVAVSGMRTFVRHDSDKENHNELQPQKTMVMKVNTFKEVQQESNEPVTIVLQDNSDDDQVEFERRQKEDFLAGSDSTAPLFAAYGSGYHSDGCDNYYDDENTRNNNFIKTSSYQHGHAGLIVDLPTTSVYEDWQNANFSIEEIKERIRQRDWLPSIRAPSFGMISPFRSSPCSARSFNRSETSRKTSGSRNGSIGSIHLADVQEYHASLIKRSDILNLILAYLIASSVILSIIGVGDWESQGDYVRYIFLSRKVFFYSVWGLNFVDKVLLYPEPGQTFKMRPSYAAVDVVVAVGSFEERMSLMDPEMINEYENTDEYELYQSRKNEGWWSLIVFAVGACSVFLTIWRSHKGHSFFSSEYDCDWRKHISCELPDSEYAQLLAAVVLFGVVYQNILQLKWIKDWWLVPIGLALGNLFELLTDLGLYYNLTEWRKLFHHPIPLSATVTTILLSDAFFLLAVIGMRKHALARQKTKPFDRDNLYYPKEERHFGSNTSSPVYDGEREEEDARQHRIAMRTGRSLSECGSDSIPINGNNATFTTDNGSSREKHSLYDEQDNTNNPYAPPEMRRVSVNYEEPSAMGLFTQLTSWTNKVYHGEESYSFDEIESVDAHDSKSPAPTRYNSNSSVTEIPKLAKGQITASAPPPQKETGLSALACLEVVKSMHERGVKLDHTARVAVYECCSTAGPEATESYKNLNARFGVTYAMTHPLSHPDRQPTTTANNNNWGHSNSTNWGNNQNNYRERSTSGNQTNQNNYRERSTSGCHSNNWRSFSNQSQY